MDSTLQVVITDTHLKNGNYKENFHIFDSACNLAVERGLDHVLHLGDIFDSRKSQTLQNLEFFKQILDEIFLEAGIMLVAISGNHDKVDYESEESYLDPYEYHPNLILISKPKVLTFADHCLALIPFFQETTILKGIFDDFVSSKEFKDAKKSKLPIIGGIHFAVSGVMNNDGTLIDNPIEPKLFKDFDIVLSGHYHNKSIVGKKINYIGASIQHTFGETSDKGITTINNKLKIETLYVEGAKEFKMLVLDIDKVGVEGAKALAKKVESDSSSDVYKVKIVGSVESVKAFDASILKSAGMKVNKVPHDDVIEYLEESLEEIEFSDDAILTEFESFCILQEYPKDIMKQGKIFLTL